MTLHGVGSWRIVEDAAAATPEAAAARDGELLEAVRAGAEGAVARIWESPRALSVARSDARLPRFAAARGALAASGWPVVVRESGGSAVPHGPGFLSLSLAFRPAPGAAATIESIYDAICRPIEAALHALGLESARGEVKGAFCAGRFDLSVGGRKIAGTAQRWRAGPGGPSPERGAVLAEALLLVDGRRSDAIDAVNRFYAEAGGERTADPEAAITLREALAQAGAPLAAAPAPELASAARAALREALRGLGGCA